VLCIMNEDILIKRLKKGDQRAFEQVVNLNKDKLLRLAMGFVHDLHQAEDIVQEVFIKLWQNIEHWQEGKAKLSTWLYKVTVNQAINQLRNKKKTSNLIDIGEFVREDEQGNIEVQLLDNSADSQKIIENKELAKILRLAINSLPRKQRIAFVLSKYQNMSSREIAEVMDITVSNVDVIIYRAKKNLQKQILKLMK